MKALKLVPIVALAALFMFVGCEHDDSSSSGGVEITKTSGILRINLGSSEFELKDGYTLFFNDSTSIQRQRESCSGFETVSITDIALDDVAEYTYKDSDKYVDYSRKTIYPEVVRFFRAECLNPSVEEDEILDSDQDDDPELQ